MKSNISSTAIVAANNAISSITLGIDLGDKKHAVCALDASGAVLEESTIANQRERLQKLSKKYPGARIVIEVGSHSPWISRLLESLGHEVFVANARKVRAIYTNTRKSDKVDAMMLARIGRMDPELLHPIRHRCEQAQRDLLHIRLRDNLVRQRVDIVCGVRFALKSLGISPAKANSRTFAGQTRKLLDASDPLLLASVAPSLQVIDILTDKIRELDRLVEQVCEESYPQTKLLRQITGVGPITSLTYVLTLGDPASFASSRDVGAYLGLVPRRDQSGAIDKQLRISKTGDSYLRSLLVGSAQYILGPFGPESDLREHGLALAGRGGRGAKKKAVVAIARKLAVLMHALLTSGGDYQPQRQPTAQAAQAA